MLFNSNLTQRILHEIQQKLHSKLFSIFHLEISKQKSRLARPSFTCRMQILSSYNLYQVLCISERKKSDKTHFVNCSAPSNIVATLKNVHM